MFWHDGCSKEEELCSSEEAELFIHALAAVTAPSGSAKGKLFLSYPFDANYALILEHFDRVVQCTSREAQGTLSGVTLFP